jgi:hypothetical protein
LEKDFEDSCFEFPRFYFLNRQQLIETLSYIRDCRKYQNTVRLCFPGIQELVFKLPQSAITALANTNKTIEEESAVDKETATNVNTTFNFDIYGNYSKIYSKHYINFVLFF